MDIQPNRLSERAIALMLIEDDPIFRVGLKTYLEQTPGFQVVLEADSSAIALQQLQPATQSSIVPPALILLSLDLGADLGANLGLTLCQQIKTQFPHRPVLLLSSRQEPQLLAAALQTGAEGYWLKGSSVTDLIQAICQIQAGRSSWPSTLTPGSSPATAIASQSTRRNPLAILRSRLHSSGLQQIEAEIASINQLLQDPNLSLVDQLVLTGRRRELNAARWVVNRLLLSPHTNPEIPPTPEAPGQPPRTEAIATPPPPDSTTSSASVPTPGAIAPTSSNSSIRSMQAVLFDATATKMQSTLYNLTEDTLEIDILKPEKKRELLYIILRKLEDILEELRFSQVTPEQLAEKPSYILQDLWQAATTDFFGKYYTIQVDDRAVEVVNVLLQDLEIVQPAILDKIPLMHEFLQHLLFQQPLTVDDGVYAIGSIEAMARMELLLHNLTIRVANAVMQPLLNRFGDQGVIKQNFYDKRLLSSREVERFRNSLSWKYRLESYISEPAAIFESRFNLFTFREAGILKTSIYALRNEELVQLSGIQFAVTLALEARDAIAPRVRSAISILGSGVVYLLTEVIGRGIGLVGRGIVKGIGSALQDTRFNRNDGRSR